MNAIRLYTLLFCFGAGMLQNAMQRSSLHSAYLKMWLYVLVQIVGIAATIAELILAFKAFRWWGFLICYGFFGLPDFINRRRWGSNPAPFFYIGLAGVAISTVLLVWF